MSKSNLNKAKITSKISECEYKDRLKDVGLGSEREHEQQSKGAIDHWAEDNSWSSVYIFSNKQGYIK